MSLHIFQKGNGQTIEGSAKIVRKNGKSVVLIEGLDLVDMISEELVGDHNGIRELAHFKVEWTVDEDA